MNLPQATRVAFRIYLTSDQIGQVVVVTTNEYTSLDEKAVKKYIISNCSGWINHLNETHDVDDFRLMTDAEILFHQSAQLEESGNENPYIRH